jgi:hypothetical protein
MKLIMLRIENKQVITINAEMIIKFTDSYQITHGSQIELYDSSVIDVIESPREIRDLCRLSQA